MGILFLAYSLEERLKVINIMRKFFSTKRTLSIVFILIICGCKGKEKKQQFPKSKQSHFSEHAGMIYIPAGEFIMGTEPGEEKNYPNTYGFVKTPYEDEQPKKKIYLKGFYIDKFEVTIGKYVEFVKATHRKLPIQWLDMGLDVERFGKYPANYITWDTASAYAKWANKKLPTEQQWEKAARGDDERRYPWGNEFDKKKGNFSKEGTLPVGSNKNDVSYFNVFDMGGNVSEWTRNIYKPYEGATYRFSSHEENLMVYRGGSWGGLGGHYYLFPYFSRSAFRGDVPREKESPLLGFRCVIEE